MNIEDQLMSRFLITRPMAISVARDARDIIAQSYDGIIPDRAKKDLDQAIALCEQRGFGVREQVETD